MLKREDFPLGSVSVEHDEGRTTLLEDAWITTLRGEPVWLFGQVPNASNAGAPAGRRRTIPWGRVVSIDSTTVAT